MATVTLSANPGTESRKYGLYRDGELVVSMHFEIINGSKVVNITTPDGTDQHKISPQEYKRPLQFFLIWTHSNGHLKNDSEITTAGLRIVAPGSFFQENQVINQEYVDRLAAKQDKAPIHISAMVREAKDLMEHLPHSQLVAVSDSSFHNTLPVVSRSYAIDRGDSKQFDLYRFGYHGISIQSVLRKMISLAGGVHDKVIVCHLGGGASVTAIRGGKSFDTSMGYSPIEGLPMITRSGNVNVDVVFELMKSKNLSELQALSYLNTQSGLKGMSGTDGDIRKLLELYEESHKGAINALDHFSYSVKKKIGAYIAAMNGLDILVITGTAGYRSPKLREMILSDLESVNLHLDYGKNESLKGDGFINVNDQTGIAVVETEELREIAFQAEKL